MVSEGLVLVESQDVLALGNLGRGDIVFVLRVEELSILEVHFVLIVTVRQGLVLKVDSEAQTHEVADGEGSEDDCRHDVVSRPNSLVDRARALDQHETIADPLELQGPQVSLLLAESAAFLHFFVVPTQRFGLLLHLRGR